VSIIQPDQRQNQLPSQFIAASAAPVDALIPPQPRRPTSGGGMAVIFCSLLLLFGVFMLLGRGPSTAPPFETLTQYACDPLPVFRGWGYARGGLLFTCRSGDKIVYVRGPPVDNSTVWNACRRAGGLIRVWRPPIPSPYGRRVFHVTCNDRVVANYPYQASNYESTQRFIIAVACGLIVLGGSGMGSGLWHRRQKDTTLTGSHQQENL
jgi:hypothetical protein